MKKFVPTALVLFVTAALAGHASTITGHITGYDGRPIRMAHVHLVTNAKSLHDDTSVVAAADGGYSITTGSTGRAILRFSGVDHMQTDVPIVIVEPTDFTIDVQLGTHDFAPVFDNVTVIGSFNNFNLGTGRRLKKNGDGTYSASFATKEPEFRYEIAYTQGGAPQHMVSANGTDAERYAYDGGGDYYSILTPRKGKVVVTFDPRKLPPPGRPEVVRIGDTTISALAEIMHHIDIRRDTMVAFIRHRLADGADFEHVSIDWATEMADLAAKITREKNRIIRAALLLSYCELSQQMGTGLDSMLAQRALAEIPPTSPLWSCLPGLVTSTIAVTGTESRYDDYFSTVVHQHPDTNVRTSELAGYLERTPYEKNPERFRAAYRLLVENYPNSEEARSARAELNPDRSIQVGRPVPAFSFASLDDPKRIISNETMKGKIYLIDFWATWCGPCIGEMPNLDVAFAKFRANNFQIISISFDRTPDAVASYRKGKWKMPWLHGFAKGAFSSDLATQFEVVGIPKPILVGADGLIIATEDDLRGQALDRTLTKMVGTGTTRN